MRVRLGLPSCGKSADAEVGFGVRAYMVGLGLRQAASSGDSGRPRWLPPSARGGAARSMLGGVLEVSPDRVEPGCRIRERVRCGAT